MEKTQTAIREDIIREVASHPSTAQLYITTLYSALELCHEVLYDLTWEKGGRLEPWQESYVVSLNNLVRELLERR